MKGLKPDEVMVATFSTKRRMARMEKVMIAEFDGLR